MGDVAPDELAIFQCGVCQAQREVDASHLTPTFKPPGCGELSSDFNEFPDGGWVHVRQWTSHGVMSDTGARLKGNPFQSQRERRLRRSAEAAKRVVAAVEARAGA